MDHSKSPEGTGGGSLHACFKSGRGPGWMGCFPGNGIPAGCRRRHSVGSEESGIAFLRDGQGAFLGFQQKIRDNPSLWNKAVCMQRGAHTTCYANSSIQPRRLYRSLVYSVHKAASGTLADSFGRAEQRSRGRREERKRCWERRKEGEGCLNKESKESRREEKEKEKAGGERRRGHLTGRGLRTSWEASRSARKSARTEGCGYAPTLGRTQVGEHRCPLIRGRGILPCVGRCTSDRDGFDEESSYESSGQGRQRKKKKAEEQSHRSNGGYKRHHYQKLARAAGIKRRCCLAGKQGGAEEEKEDELSGKGGKRFGEGVGTVGTEESEERKEGLEEKEEEEKEREERRRPIEQWGDQFLRGELYRAFGRGWRGRVEEQRGVRSPHGEEESRKTGLGAGAASSACSSPAGSELGCNFALQQRQSGPRNQDPELLPGDPETATWEHQCTSSRDVPHCDGLGLAAEGTSKPGRGCFGGEILCAPPEPDRWPLAGGETLRDPCPGRGDIDNHSGTASNEASCQDGSKGTRVGSPKWKLALWLGSWTRRQRRKMERKRWRMERRKPQGGQRKRKGKERKGPQRRGPRRPAAGMGPEGGSGGEIEDGCGLAGRRRALYGKYEPLEVFTLGSGRCIGWGTVLNLSKSLSHLGLVISWLLNQTIFNAKGRLVDESLVRCIVGKVAAETTLLPMRQRGEVFPFRIGQLERFCGILLRMAIEEVVDDEFVESFAAYGWTLCLLVGSGVLAGVGAVLETGPWTQKERAMVRGLYEAAKRRCQKDTLCTADPTAMDHEMASKRVGYNGEEIGGCHQLTVEQVFPALPPEAHGGSINALDWLGPSSKEFLLHPENCLVKDADLSKACIPGRVHVKKGEKLIISKELVKRKVCGWVPLSQVVEVKGVKILNGLFGVEKPTVTNSGKPILRLIMNLVASNLILKQLKGKVQALPSINSWQSTFMDQGEELRLFQSDMSSAFYLFMIPSCWLPYLAFNIIVDGGEINRQKGIPYALACSVLPMGWASSVGLMQEISENILLWGGISREHQIRRGSPLPTWMCDTLFSAKREGRYWWHVYLDNFCACEKIFPTSPAVLGDRCHQLAEELWQKSGVVSSEKKRKRLEEDIEELGAEVDGVVGTLGGSALRKLKIGHLTLHLLSKPYLNRKHIQILAGRWVFLMQFRRPSMSIFNAVWSFISENLKEKKQTISQVRQELMCAILLLPVLVTDLRAPPCPIIGASDASTTGGAVSVASSLTEEGKDFVAATMVSQPCLRQSPILVVSLFNGIGGCFRCYDIIGVKPVGRISFDLCKEANRIVERRWPGTRMLGDVRDINYEMVQEWEHEFGDVEEVHAWGGFPCVDLSSAKAYRKNLDGPQSSLFWEIPRILQLIRAVFQGRARVKHCFENVASMDREAAETISHALGCSPYKVDCVEAVPMRRPRFAWTSEKIEGILPGVEVTRQRLWNEVYAAAPYPQTQCWLEPGTQWEGESERACFPTCMKAIVRDRPPPRPAGIEKCDESTLQRWEADQYRYPPYQYKSSYVIRGKKGWRLLSAVERELLLGYGYRHTSLCLSASNIKASKTKYEDIRCSLLGDSFSIYSFVIFAYVMAIKFVTKVDYQHLVNRMGIAPGFVASPRLIAPLTRMLSYGSPKTIRKEVEMVNLNELLLRSTDHTGSDVRIISGETLGKKIFPRQSVSAQWWTWVPVFKTRWKYKSHINLLELEAIILGVKHQVYRLGFTGCRMFHISDSYVCISIVSKGRSSSRLLQRRLKYLAALLLASNVQLVLAHVESTDNPTDEASRS